MKVFVSSTVYDLLDVRAEVAALLRSCGISAILSDEKVSDFSIPPDKNSIETCLVNVDACDEMVVILDKRYGHRLGKFDFEDISATHLEYHRFLPTKKQIHFFVRDRLEADYTLWKKNKKRTDIDYAWVEKKDLALFDFLEERRNLTADKARPNWITFFSDSADLKTILTKYFEEALLPQRLADAIYNNTFPLFAIKSSLEAIPYFGNLARITVANVGASTALNTRVYFGTIKSEMDHERLFIAPNQIIDKMLPIEPPQMKEGEERTEPLFIEYESMVGISVFEEHAIRVRKLQGGGYMVTPSPKSRRFKRAEKPTFTISEK